MKYDKLVRDKIPEIILQKGGKPVAHVADANKYWEKLKEKLQEEVAEFIKDETMEEIADILEVVEAISAYKGFDALELQTVKHKKAEERGKFEKRIILYES